MANDAEPFTSSMPLKRLPSEASETVVSDGDVAGRIFWNVFDGTDYGRIAEITGLVEEGTPAAGARPILQDSAGLSSPDMRGVL